MSIYIALGGNLPARYHGKTLAVEQTFTAAMAGLEMRGIQTVRNSALWQSPAWPNPDAQPAYINAVAEIETDLTPYTLLSALKDTEIEFGRQPSVRNAARPLDLDILDYNGQILQAPKLTLPHARMTGRAFVLFPLMEIAPDWHDPIKNRAAHDWTARLSFCDVASLTRIGFTSAYRQVRRG